MAKSYMYNNILVLRTKTDEKPKCKLCGSDLIARPKNEGTYAIKSCSNPECECFNTKSVKIKRKAFIGEEYAEEQTKHKKEKNPLCVEYGISKGFTKEEARNEVSKIQSTFSKQVKNRGRCDKKIIEEKLGKEEADVFFRKKSRYCIEYGTNRGFTEEEGKEKIKELQTKYSKISNSSIEQIRKKSGRCPEYWINKHNCTLDEAKEIISNKQKHFSKEICIEKYGEEKGLEIGEERQKKGQKSLHESGNLHVGFSKISQTLFETILKHYNKDDRDFVFYGKKNREYSIRENDTNYIYDFTDLNKRKIIEFQGDIYHANPLLYGEDDKPNPYKKDKTSKDLWEYDEKKKNIAIKNIFSFLSIGEKEYRENKKEVINKILVFLELC